MALRCGPTARPPGRHRRAGRLLVLGRVGPAPHRPGHLDQGDPRRCSSSTFSSPDSGGPRRTAVALPPARHPRHLRGRPPRVEAPTSPGAVADRPGGRGRLDAQPVAVRSSPACTTRPARRACSRSPSPRCAARVGMSRACNAHAEGDELAASPGRAHRQVISPIRGRSPGIRGTGDPRSLADATLRRRAAGQWLGRTTVSAWTRAEGRCGTRPERSWSTWSSWSRRSGGCAHRLPEGSHYDSGLWGVLAENSLAIAVIALVAAMPWRMGAEPAFAPPRSLARPSHAVERPPPWSAPDRPDPAAAWRARRAVVAGHPVVRHGVRWLLSTPWRGGGSGSTGAGRSPTSWRAAPRSPGHPQAVVARTPARYDDAAVAGIHELLGRAPDPPAHRRPGPDGHHRGDQRPAGADGRAYRPGDHAGVRRRAADRLSEPPADLRPAHHPPRAARPTGDRGRRAGGPRDGTVPTPVDLDRLAVALREAHADGFRAVAVVCLHSHLLPRPTSRRSAPSPPELGFPQVSLSSEVSPLMKLVRRADTCAGRRLPHADPAPLRRPGGGATPGSPA